MTTLHIIQDYFARLIVHPTGAADGLKELREEDPATPALTAIFGETESLPALERVEIYASMYFFRLLEVLQNETPKVAALLGHDRFHNLVTDFLIAHPSRNPDIGRIAGPLPDFLRVRPLPEFPGLHELARLELSRSRVFIAANPPPLLALADLQALPPESLGTLSLQLIPAFDLLALDHPVHELWQAVEDKKDLEEALAAFAPRVTRLRIWREGFRVFHKEVDETEFGALALARAGCTFADICESLSDRDDPAAAAAQLLMSWINDGLLVRMSRSFSLPVI
jgi:hypothetical protein